MNFRCLSALVFLLTPLGLLVLRADDPGKVTIKPGKDQVEFFIDGKLVTRYHVGPDQPKPIFWPVYAPGDVAVTRAWPVDKGQKVATTDHTHHRSVWFCHGDVVAEGLQLKDKIKGVEGVDFWAEPKGHGRIVCTKVGDPKMGPGKASILTTNEWRTADGTKVLDETRGVTLHDLGKGRLIVLDIDLHASVYPIIFADTKEGAMAIRIHDNMRETGGGNGTLTNAEGKTKEKNIWGLKSAWCDYSGELDGKKAGIAILDDPSNPYPALWHSRGYGLMAANPFGGKKSQFPAAKGKTDSVRLAKGEHLKLRYGVLLHSGDVREGQVAEMYQQFVQTRDKK